MSGTDGDGERASREQRAWESIVADLSGQLNLPQGTPAEGGHPSMAERDEAFVDALLGDGPDVGLEPDDDDDPSRSFEPPDPGPFPVPADAISRAAWAAALGGPILVMAAFVFGLGTFIAGIGVAAFVAGFIALITRLPDREHGEDDGAVV